MKFKIIVMLFLLITAQFDLVLAQGTCTTARYDRDFFERLKQNNFIPQESIRENTLVLMLADCLGDPDPALRDGIAYEGIATMLRRGRVDNAGIRRLLDKCETYLNDETDEYGVRKPFAALCIAEVARTDRTNPHFSEEDRSRVIRIGSNYLKTISDYRGFDEKEGWRHAVAHTADLLMQLSLNENIGADEHRLMLSAIASQVSPMGHFYIYGEPARLARPVLFMAMQGTLNEEEWTEWFLEISDPQPEMENWEQAFSSNAGLAKRHNLTAFLSALRIGAAGNENVKAILPGLSAAFDNIP